MQFPTDLKILIHPFWLQLNFKPELTCMLFCSSKFSYLLLPFSGIILAFTIFCRISFKILRFTAHQKNYYLFPPKQLQPVWTLTPEKQNRYSPPPFTANPNQLTIKQQAAINALVKLAVYLMCKLGGCGSTLLVSFWSQLARGVNNWVFFGFYSVFV